MFGWAFPSRRGSAPVSSADSPTFTSAESAVSSSEISMRSPPPACPRATRALDLDDVRAEVGEQHRAVRARENAGEVEHADRGGRQHRAIVRPLFCKPPIAV